MNNIPQNIHMLLVDDEPEIINALKRIFRRSKYTIHSANGGQEALNIIDDNSIDIIISDVKMPSMSGASLLSQIAKEWPDTIRIVLTGHSDLTDTLKLVNEANIYRYFTKPWVKGDLIKAVEQGVKQIQLTRENKALLALTNEQNEQLIKLNAALGEQVAHTATKLSDTEEQLDKERELEQESKNAQRIAEQASEAKGRFLATMSHEMRSPLNAIIIMNQLLLESKLNTEQREHAKQAHQAGEILLALINDVLDFSKIEAGQLDLEHSPFDLYKCVESCSCFLITQAKLKGLTLSIDIADTVPQWQTGDEARLRQILINLINNAIKFTDHGFIKLSITTTSDNKTLQFIVEDSGIGISEENQKTIFKEFIQVEDANNRQYGGTGLGLSIVKKLLSLMHGQLSVSSEINVGTQFSFTIPSIATKESSDTQQEISLYKRHELETLSVKTPVHILLVEDSPANVAVIKALLGKLSVKISHASNGKIAVDKAKKHTYSVILMDVSMPVMDGLEATKLIRNSDNKNTHTPIIAMTANAFSKDKQACFTAGMDDYLAKPIISKLFYHYLYLWLSGEKIHGLTAPAINNSVTVASLETPPMNHVNVESNNKDNNDLINTKIVDRLIQDIGVDNLPTILDIYKSETQKRLPQMRNLLSQDPSEDLAHLLASHAHALKSSSGSFGFHIMQQKAQWIEVNSLNPPFNQDLIDIVSGLEQIYHRSCEQLTRYLNSLVS